MGYRHISNLYANRDILHFKRCIAMEKIHGCLNKETAIAAIGGYKLIKDVNPGDKVFSFDEQRKTFIVATVLKKIVGPVEGKWISLTLENGKRLILTEDHKILTKRGWVKAKDLSKQDDLISI